MSDIFNLSATNIFYLTPLLLLSYWVILAVKRAYFTPLRRIPGPWYAKFTHLWLKKQVLAGRRMHYIHHLHQKYGPMVRIAPNEVDVADLEGYREIHRIGSGFSKGDWYLSFRDGEDGFHDILTTIPNKEHAERRKLFAQSFSVSSLRTNWETSIVEKVKYTIEQIKMEAQQGESDMYKWWTCMTTDVISHFAFGESFDMLRNTERNEFLDKIEVAVQMGGKQAELPWLYAILKILPFEFAKEMLSAGEKADEYGRKAIARTKTDPLSYHNVFSKMIIEAEKGTGSMTEAQVAHEAGGFIVAGSGTTAVTLTYLVWAVLSNPSIQSRLEEEVSRLPEEFNDSDLERLPYLNAVIDETLRLYGAAPGSLPRKVPRGGATLGGYLIPGGTTVCTQAYTINRDSVLYPNPDNFDPSRFCSPSGEYNPPKATYSAAFGGGSRICLGIHLARMELRHSVAYFFRECRGARVAPSTTEKSMEMVNYFLITPAAAKCNITL